jgi:hypothetical protein
MAAAAAAAQRQTLVTSSTAQANGMMTNILTIDAAC